jgi:outer membrane protein assembly factor BamB
MDSSRLPLSAPPNLCAFSPDGRALAVVHATSLTVFDVDRRAVTAQGPVGGVVYASGFTADGAALLLGTRTPTRFDLATQRPAKAVFKGPGSAANALAVSADGRTVYFANGSFMASGDNFVYAFDLATAAPRWRVFTARGEGNNDVAVLDERVVVFGEQGAVFALDPAKGAVTARAQLSPPADLGESMIFGARASGDTVVAATLEGRAPRVARLRVNAQGIIELWRTDLALPDADVDEGVFVGRPMVFGARAHVPVCACFGGLARVTLFAFDLETGAARGSEVLDGCQSHRAVAGSAGGAIAWACGPDAVALGIL